jgi:hypothetical protein
MGRSRSVARLGALLRRATSEFNVAETTTVQSRAFSSGKSSSVIGSIRNALVRPTSGAGAFNVTCSSHSELENRGVCSGLGGLARRSSRALPLILTKKGVFGAEAVIRDPVGDVDHSCRSGDMCVAVALDGSDGSSVPQPRVFSHPTFAGHDRL